MSDPDSSGGVARRSNWRRRFCWVGAAAGLVALVWCARARGPLPPTEVYRGVVLLAERLPETAETGGLLYLVRVDLTAPGVDLFTTPLDQHAESAGWQYRLASPSEILARNSLAVVVNGAQFKSASHRIPLSQSNSIPLYRPGDLARTNETIIADSQVTHARSSLLWFDSDLRPHLERDRSLGEEPRARAKWGIGTQRVLVAGGVPELGLTETADCRSALGVDAEKQLLWVAVFEKASLRAAAAALHRHGAKDAILLDGGSSTCLVLGPRARGVRPGTIVGGAVPVATHFGIRALPLQ